MLQSIIRDVTEYVGAGTQMFEDFGSLLEFLFSVWMQLWKNAIMITGIALNWI